MSTVFLQFLELTNHYDYTVNTFLPRKLSNTAIRARINPAGKKINKNHFIYFLYHFINTNLFIGIVLTDNFRANVGRICHWLV